MKDFAKINKLEKRVNELYFNTFTTFSKDNKEQVKHYTKCRKIAFKEMFVK